MIIEMPKLMNRIQIQEKQEIQETEELERIWERMPDEPDMWYIRFKEFLNTGPGRSFLHLANTERERKGKSALVAVSASWNYSATKWKWRERASAYDNYLVNKEAERLEEKTKELNDKSFKLIEQMIAKAEQMLTFPLQTVVHEDKDVDGKLVAQTTIIPSRWVMRDAASILKTATDMLNAKQGINPTLNLNENKVVTFDLSNIPVEVLRDISNEDEFSESEDGSDKNFSVQKSN